MQLEVFVPAILASGFAGGLLYRIRGGAADVLETGSLFLSRLLWSGMTGLFIFLLTLHKLMIEGSLPLWEFLPVLICPPFIFLGLLIPHAWGQYAGNREKSEVWRQGKRDQWEQGFWWTYLDLPEYDNDIDPLWKRKLQDFFYMAAVGTVRSLAYIPLLITFGAGALFAPLILGWQHGAYYLLYPSLPMINFLGEGNRAAIHGGTSWAEFFWGAAQWMFIFALAVPVS